MAEESSGFCSMPQTQWSLVMRAGGQIDGDQRQALAELVRQYMPALRTHLMRRKRMKGPDADDLLQEFLEKKVVAKQDLLGSADEQQGKFRTLLLTALDRFFIDRYRRDHAQKRNPGQLAMLDKQPEPDDGRQGAADVFDVEWARQVMRQTLERMRAQCNVPERRGWWALFEGRVLGPILDGNAPASYAELVEQYGYESEGQAANALVSAKRMYQRTLRDVIAQYVQDESQIDSEILDLRAILSRAGA